MCIGNTNEHVMIDENEFLLKLGDLYRKEFSLVGEIISELNKIYNHELWTTYLLKKARSHILKWYSQSKSHKTRIDIFITTAVVLLAEKEYEAKYWTHFFTTLSLESFTQQRIRDIVSSSFVQTVTNFNMYFYKDPDSKGNTQYVYNFVIHCIIPNAYYHEFFSLIYTFYKHDLRYRWDQELTLIDEVFDSIQQMIKNGDSAQTDQFRLGETALTYRIIKSIRMNIFYQKAIMKERFLYWLDRIDYVYWQQNYDEFELSMNTPDKNEFIKWANATLMLDAKKNKMKRSLLNHIRQFSKPYFSYIVESNHLYLNIPQQTLKQQEFVLNPEIIIEINGEKEQKHREFSIYQSFTGFQTEPETILLKEIPQSLEIKYFNRTYTMDCSFLLFDTDGLQVDLNAKNLTEAMLIVKSNDEVVMNEIYCLEKYTIEPYQRLMIAIDDQFKFTLNNQIYYRKNNRIGINGDLLINQENLHSIFNNEVVPIFKQLDSLYILNYDQSLNYELIVNQSRYSISKLLEEMKYYPLNSELVLPLNSIIEDNNYLQFEVRDLNENQRLFEYSLLYIKDLYVQLEQMNIDIDTYLEITLNNKKYMIHENVVLQKDYIDIEFEKFPIYIKNPFFRYKIGSFPWANQLVNNIWYEDIKVTDLLVIQSPDFDSNDFVHSFGCVGYKQMPMNNTFTIYPFHALFDQEYTIEYFSAKYKKSKPIYHVLKKSKIEHIDYEYDDLKSTLTIKVNQIGNEPYFYIIQDPLGNELTIINELKSINIVDNFELNHSSYFLHFYKKNETSFFSTSIELVDKKEIHLLRTFNLTGKKIKVYEGTGETEGKPYKIIRFTIKLLEYDEDSESYSAMGYYSDSGWEIPLNAYNPLKVEVFNIDENNVELSIFDQDESTLVYNKSNKTIERENLEQKDRNKFTTLDGFKGYFK